MATLTVSLCRYVLVNHFDLSPLPCRHHAHTRAQATHHAPRHCVCVCHSLCSGLLCPGLFAGVHQVQRRNFGSFAPLEVCHCEHRVRAHTRVTRVCARMCAPKVYGRIYVCMCACMGVCVCDGCVRVRWVCAGAGRYFQLQTHVWPRPPKHTLQTVPSNTALIRNCNYRTAWGQ